MKEVQFIVLAHIRAQSSLDLALASNDTLSVNSTSPWTEGSCSPYSDDLTSPLPFVWVTKTRVRQNNAVIIIVTAGNVCCCCCFFPKRSLLKGKTIHQKFLFEAQNFQGRKILAAPKRKKSKLEMTSHQKTGTWR